MHIHPDASPMPTQSANGQAHLTYYDEGTSFVWSGQLVDPIEVCEGGYGEPVTDHIELDLGAIASFQTAPSVVGVLAVFTDLCLEWLQDH